MKNITLFLIVLLCGTTLKSQDIINRTGTGGKFIIENSNGDTEFAFKTNQIGQAEMIIGKNTFDFFPDLYELNIQSNSIGPFASFTNFTSASSGPRLYFQKARNNPPTTDLVLDDELGTISFFGYKGSFKESASIRTKVTDPGNSTPAANISFFTSSGDQATERFQIKSNGAIHFKPMASDPAGAAEAGDVYYNSTDNKLKVYNGTAWVDLN